MKAKRNLKIFKRASIGQLGVYLISLIKVVGDRPQKSIMENLGSCYIRESLSNDWEMN